MNLRYSLGWGQRIWRFVGEIIYNMFMVILGLSGWELIWIFNLIRVQNVKLDFFLLGAIIFFVVKNCDDYFVSSPKLKKPFVVLTMLEIISFYVLIFLVGVKTSNATLISNVIWFFLSIMTILIVIILATQVLFRVTETLVWVFFPYIEKKENDIQQTAMVSIIGENSQYLTHSNISVYASLSIIRIILILIFSVYILGYISVVFPALKESYKPFRDFANLIKLSESFDLADLIQLLAVMVSFEAYINSFQDKLRAKIIKNKDKDKTGF